MIQTNPYIWTKKKSLKKKFCKQVISKFKKDDNKYQGLVGFQKELLTDMKSSTDLVISHDPLWKPEDDIFYRSLTEGIIEYITHLKETINLVFFDKLKNKVSEIDPHLSTVTNDTGYQIQETKIGEYYDWHHDASFISANGVSQLRKFTFIWYLNDVEEGGETEFYDGTLIKPKAGTLLIFPAQWSYYHRGRPPKSNTKYIATGWVTDDLQH